MKLEFKLQCSRCKSYLFTINKVSSGKDAKSIIMHETLCHDGFGFDMNEFIYTCLNCSNEEVSISQKEIKE